MKKPLILLLCSIHALIVIAQSPLADSLKQSLESETQDTSRVLLFAKLSTAYRNEKPEVGLVFAQQGLELARKIKYPAGEGICLNALGHNYRMTANFSQGLKSHFDALKIFEKLKDQLGITLSYHGISGNYEDMKDFKESLIYAYKVKALAETLHNMHELMIIESNMGNSFEQINQLDSALHYVQNSYEITVSTKDFTSAGSTMARLGNIHTKMGNDNMAVDFYHLGISIAASYRDNNSLNEIYHGLASLFQKKGQIDSSIYYAKMALATGAELNSPDMVATECSLLSSLYNQDHHIDSAFKYLRLAAITKDTLMTRDKLKQIQVLAFEEKNREREVAETLQKEKHVRERNIEYAAIGIGSISLLILFLLLSHSIIVNAKWIKFFGIIGLLIVFEFVNLVLHPYLANVTNDSPLLMLVALVGIAAMLIPLHHWLEKWVTRKMVAKNKKIRLSAARKTIAKLEGEADLKGD